MKQNKIVQIIPVLRLKRDLHYFDYLAPLDFESQIKIGQLVEIPFKNKIIKGIIFAWGKKNESDDFKLKEVSKIVAEEPFLNTWQLQLIQDMAADYFVSMAMILKMFRPDIPKKIRISKNKFVQGITFLKAPQPDLQVAPYLASNKPVLIRYFNQLNKIKLYLSLIETVCRKNKQVLIIVPVLAELVRIYQYLGDYKHETVVFLNDLSKNNYWQAWQKIKSGEAKIIIGTRSAIFAPFNNLDLIIIDEEDNENHKQEEPNPRYNVKTVALYLSKLLSAKIIFTALSPAINSLYQVMQKNWLYFELDKISEHPQIKIIDRQIEFKKKNYTLFGEYLLQKIAETLKQDKQVFLFLNRKGSATLVACRDCGFLATCPTCKLPLTYYQSKKMFCQHCNYQQDMFLFCPKCKSSNIKITGSGTEKVEIELNKIYPEAKILKLDLDTPLNDNKIADYNIIIGTQYAFERLDWQNIHVAGVLNADTLLYLPDYRSMEKTFCLLIKLAVYLSNKDKDLIIQTFSPDNYIFQAIQTLNYKLFYQKDFTERKSLFYPPANKLIKLIYQNHEFNFGQVEITKIYENLKLQVDPTKVNINPPLLAYTQQVRGRFRWYIIIKILEKDTPLDFLKSLPENIIIDVEPESLL